MVGKLHVKKVRTQESPPWSSGYNSRPLVPPPHLHLGVSDSVDLGGPESVHL